jgi:hypothetical protein
VRAAPPPESPPPTHAPCDYHGASTPYILLVDSTSATGENVTLTELSGAGSIGGCPVVATTEPESVAITVCLQRLDPVTAAWVDDVCAPFAKSWNRYWPYARQAGGTVNTLCVPGTWRIDVRGGDGFEPAGWAAEPATFDCLELSGGD